VFYDVWLSFMMDVISSMMDVISSMMDVISFTMMDVPRMVDGFI
jgi:phage-related protein